MAEFRRSFCGGGDVNTDGGAIFGFGLEKEVAVEKLGAFAHAEQPEMSVRLGFDNALGGETAAIVLDLQKQAILLRCESDPGLVGAGVILDILQPLLGETEKMGEVVLVEGADGSGVSARRVRLRRCTW